MNEQNIYFESGLSIDEATKLALRSDFASLIRERLLSDYRTQKQAEQALGIPQSTISNIMCGNTSRLSLDYLVGLAARLTIPWSARCWSPPHDAGVVAGPGAAAVTRENNFSFADDLAHADTIRRLPSGTGKRNAAT